MVRIKTCRGDFGLHERKVVAFSDMFKRHQHSARHLPACHHVTCEHEIRHATGVNRIGVGFALGHKELHHI